MENPTSPNSVKKSTTVNVQSTVDDVETSMYKTTDAGELKDHNESIHTSNSLFTCDICLEEFSCFDDLRKHTDEFHGKQQDNYNCQECEFKTDVEVDFAS